MNTVLVQQLCCRFSLGLALVSMDIWTRDPLFNRYWETYSACQRWMQRHMAVSEHVQTVYRNGGVIRPPPSPPIISKRRKSRLSSRKRRRVIPPDQYKGSERQDVPSSSRNVDPDAWMTCEKTVVPPERRENMTEEMVAFFRQTVLHRLERKTT